MLLFATVLLEVEQAVGARGALAAACGFRRGDGV